MKHRPFPLPEPRELRLTVAAPDDPNLPRPRGARVLAEFEDETQALKALEQWKRDPLVSSAMPFRKGSSDGQTELSLGPYKSKRQPKFDAVKRRLK